MKKVDFMGKYPVYEMTVPKVQSQYSSVDSIIAYLQQQIDTHPIASYIAMFDQYAHTAKIGGEIHATIKEAKEIIFCFGQKLPNATILAIRPRAIAVVEMDENFTISFMEAPNEPSTLQMREWVKSIKKA